MRRLIPLLLALAAFNAPVGTQNALEQSPDQQPAAQSEQEQLEQEFIESKIANGESHASGARPELGPVVLGNPTTAVVALRVGLYASTFTSTGALAVEYASLHHLSADLTNTAGVVMVIDRSTGKEIAVMSP